MLQNICTIALGSSIGGVLRWLLTKFFQKFSFYNFPLGTFFVNVLCCFCIGLFYAVFEKYNIGNQSVRLFLTVGFCGSFTTFSTFMHENLMLLQGQELFISLLYLTLSIILGTLAVIGGANIIKCC